MRAEFVKRLFDKTKGVYRGQDPPVTGTVYVWRVELDGAIYDHTGKSVSQVSVVRPGSAPNSPEAQPGQ
jgi:hypothetical protein